MTDPHPLSGPAPEPTVLIEVPADLASVVRDMIARYHGLPPADASHAGALANPRRLTSIPQMVALACLAGVYQWLMVSYIPRFKDVLADFKMELPSSTRTALRMSDFFIASYGSWWIWLIPTLVPFATSRLIHLEKVRPATRLTLLIVMTVLVALLSLFLAYAVMAAPMVQLIEGMSASRH